VPDTSFQQFFHEQWKKLPPDGKRRLAEKVFSTVPTIQQYTTGFRKPSKRMEMLLRQNLEQE
jgi:hypothetical protein